MKVLHLISGGDSGGAKTHVFALLDKLKLYADITVACFMDGVFYQEIQHKDINLKFFEQKNRFDLSIINKMVDFIKNEKFEIIHAHGARANFVAYFIKKKCKIPIVTTMHSDYKLDFTDGFYKKFVFTNLNAIALRKLDYYIAVSNSFKQMLINRKFTPNKIFTVYNGMDYNKPMDYISREEFAVRHGIELLENEIYVGIIGRFDAVKGHEIFINGAAELLKTNKNITFLLAGEGEGKQKLEQQAKQLGIENKVKFLGFISDIYSFINFIDINTLTSHSESFPYVLLEGAKMKKATVCSDVGGIKDLVCDGKTGLLFDMPNHKEFAEKLKTLVDNKELIKSYGDALFDLATSTFSSENLALSHMEIYKSIINDYYNKKKYDVVISGYYGFGNSGDDALLFAIIDTLKAIKSDIRILALSACAKETQEIYGVDAKNRFNIISAGRAIKKASLFINGGGSLIQDVTSTQSLMYYLFMMNYAKRHGLKVYVYANGIGPLKQTNINITRKILNKVDYITLRDEMSMEELKRIGIKENIPIKVTADPAIILEGTQGINVAKLVDNKTFSQGDKYVAFSIRQWNKSASDFEENIAKVGDYLYDKYKLKSLFLPFKYYEDSKICKRIIAKMKNDAYIIKEELSIKDTIGIIGKSEFAIGMRLHSLIYAFSTSRKSIALSYDPKIDGFMQFVGQKNSISVEGFTARELEIMIDGIIKDESNDYCQFCQRVAELKEKAVENATIAIEILQTQQKQD